MSFQALLNDHGDAGPDITLLFRVDPDSHVVDFECTHEEVSNGSNIAFVTDASVIKNGHMGSCSIADGFAIDIKGLIFTKPRVKLVQKYFTWFTF